METMITLLVTACGGMVALLLATSFVMYKISRREGRSVHETAQYSNSPILPLLTNLTELSVIAFGGASVCFFLELIRRLVLEIWR